LELDSSHVIRPKAAKRAFLGLALVLVGSRAHGAGPPLMIDASAATPARQRLIRQTAEHYRVVVDAVPLPSPGLASPEQVAIEQRAEAVRLALARARKNESEALWDDCIREAAGVMSDAIEVIDRTGEVSLVRDLHLQTGVCMSLANQGQGARLHFLAAALLDETAPPTGLHREEAEAVQAESREEVLSRPHGKVRIVSDPPGATVLIDGRPVPGVTPVDADVRLGDHFVTLRRFRFEANTEQRFLQPSGIIRVELDPARRTTLAEQLSEIQLGRAPAPSREELELAEASWSRAEQVLMLLPPGGSGPNANVYRLSLVEIGSGRPVRTVLVPASADEAAVRRSVCDALGESCDVSRGIPWYVWPLAGAVVIGGVVTTAVILENNRDTRFCPPVGCR
jgi:hypothetical protein